MISITAIIKSKPEYLEQVHNSLLHLVTETRKEKDCVRYDLHASKNSFIIWEEWTHQAGLDIHNEKPYILQFISQSEKLLSAPIQVYKTVQIL